MCPGSVKFQHSHGFKHLHNYLVIKQLIDGTSAMVDGGHNGSLGSGSLCFLLVCVLMPT